MSQHHRVTGRQQLLFRRAVLDRDGYKCVRCGKRSRLEADHIVPLSEGGAHHPDNGQALCRDCHMAKTAKQEGNDYAGKSEWAAFVNETPWERRRAKLR